MIDPTQKQGDATRFGGVGDVISFWDAVRQGQTKRQALKVGDPGVGAPSLGTVSSTNSYGIAVPTQYLQQNFGSDPANWRTARGTLTVGDQTVTVPFIDIGPSKAQQKSGVVVDVSQPLSDALGGFDRTQASVKLLPKAGPDPIEDSDAWYKEQQQIAQRLNVPGVGAEPSPTPLGSTEPSMTQKILNIANLQSANVSPEDVRKALQALSS